MKNPDRLLITIFLFHNLAVSAAGDLQVRNYNFTGFHKEEKKVTAELLKNTPLEFRQHPEFGMLPYKAGCNNCIELLQKRSLYSRYFIEPDDASHFYVQQSYTPLHFIDDSGLMRTIDPRLKPVGGNPGIYSASNQPVPTKYDAIQHKTYISSSGVEFGFNRNLKIYFMDYSGGKHQMSSIDFTNTSVGEGGVMTRNAWKDIDMRQIFEKGSVETDFVINKPLALPDGAAWLVFEDEIVLPNGFSMVKGALGKVSEEGYLIGNLVVEQNGVIYIDYDKPIYYDQLGQRIPGIYNLEGTSSSFKVKLLVPVSFLTNSQLRYPVYIDPLVSGRDSIGRFLNPPTVNSGANLAFTNANLGSCDYMLNVTVPGKSKLMDALIDIEYKTSDSICAAPYCSFSDLSQEVVGPCFSTGPLACSTSGATFGICTTDPNKVPGAGALRMVEFLDCVPGQCQDYQTTFTLKNRSFQCPETCGHNCATGSFFAVTVEGRTLEADITAEADSVNAGEPVTLTSLPQFGVPPYTYLWTPSGGSDSTEQVFPFTDETYVLIVTDLCGNSATDSLTVIVNNTGTGAYTLFSTNPCCTIYPNPTSGEVKLRVENVREELSIKLLDALGRTEWLKVLNEYQLRQGIEINLLERGIYFLNVSSKSENWVMKLVRY